MADGVDGLSDGNANTDAVSGNFGDMIATLKETTTQIGEQKFGVSIGATLAKAEGDTITLIANKT